MHYFTVYNFLSNYNELNKKRKMQHQPEIDVYYNYTKNDVHKNYVKGKKIERHLPGYYL